MNDRPVSSVEDVIQQVAAASADFASRIRGCDPADLDRLEEVVQRRLPRVYRDYMLRMGAGDSGLDLLCGTYHDAEMILRFYQEYDPRDEPVDPRYLVVGLSGLEVEQLFLDLESGEQAALYYGQSNDVVGQMTTSLLTRLCFCSHIHEHFAAGARGKETLRLTAKDRRRRLGTVRRVALRLGFTVLEPADRFAFFAVHPEGYTLAAQRWERGYCVAQLSYPSALGHAAVTNQLATECGLFRVNVP